MLEKFLQDIISTRCGESCPHGHHRRLAHQELSRYYRPTSESWTAACQNSDSFIHVWNQPGKEKHFAKNQCSLICSLIYNENRTAFFISHARVVLLECSDLLAQIPRCCHIASIWQVSKKQNNNFTLLLFWKGMNPFFGIKSYLQTVIITTDILILILIRHHEAQCTHQTQEAVPPLLPQHRLSHAKRWQSHQNQ